MLVSGVCGGIIDGCEADKSVTCRFKANKDVRDEIRSVPTQWVSLSRFQIHYRSWRAGMGGGLLKCIRSVVLARID